MNNTELYIIMAEHFKLDGGACFGVVPKSIWSKLWQPDENNMLPVCNRCLLVRDGERLILIDTGIGDKQTGKFREYLYLSGDDTLLDSLQKHGIDPADITDVLHTHLHFDHCGGSVRYNTGGDGFELVFPNATYWCSKTQWERATQPNVREGASYFKENLQPMADSGKLRFIEDGNFSPNISVRIYSGHTGGQAIPFISHQGKTIVFMADFIPTALHMPLAWVPSYDTEPLITMQEKGDFLKEAADNQYILFFEHDSEREACLVEHTEKGIRAGKTGMLQMFIS
jgi:glyoxylase-like metal-dependent hydrolase (beta-lactamase superfamily II)